MVEMEEVLILITVEEVSHDFENRRAGLIKALTTDADNFFEQCHHPDNEELSLYGLPNCTWKVDLFFKEVPSKLPQPACGINIAREFMGGWVRRRRWLLMVAVHSDSWLIAVAFHFAALIGLGKSDRYKLFGMINELPTLFELLVGLESGCESPCIRYRESSIKEERDFGKEEIVRSTLRCGTCGSGVDEEQTESWMRCDMCDLWFHVRCVKLKPAKAAHLARFNCPHCVASKQNPQTTQVLST